ncbi:sensor domain-containing diguanylate cyclase (plasmid) [Pseudoalteromonas sp. T1lg65]|uniref:sensor domain-containing diguanylate cyclase n=1 Tax=Pseudoalteromonas sp. T1lg65 TaxID=2077101 RepID=UPI003F78CB11
MTTTVKPWLDLKKLILLLATLSVIFSLLNALTSSYKVQQKVLVNDTLSANKAYAEKLADVTNLLLTTSLMQLKAASEAIAPNLDNNENVNRELLRLLTQTNSFDSAVVVNQQGQIIAAQPSSLAIIGVSLQSEVERSPLYHRQPAIVGPFVSPAKNLMVSPTHPIFSSDGEYLGFIAAGVYLKGENILSKLLASHHHNDQTYVYVVGPEGKLIYHHDESRVGENVATNKAVTELINGRDGAMELTNTRGVTMLAGYAPIETSNWGVVVQRPVQVTMDQLENTMIVVLKSAIPITVLLLVLVFWVGTAISKPLWKLAKLQEQAKDDRELHLASISTWYYEAAWLKRAMFASAETFGQRIRLLDDERKKDQLTGLNNRRGMEQWLRHSEVELASIAIITLDIDHFKNVNDTYGHDTGDKVIRKLAELMKINARAEDHLCRSGGEEFFVFVPNTTIEAAFSVAERLRISVSQAEFPHQQQLTISVGVAHWPTTTPVLQHAIKLADKALYRAKRNGRNQTVVASSE